MSDIKNYSKDQKTSSAEGTVKPETAKVEEAKVEESKPITLDEHLSEMESESTLFPDDVEVTPIVKVSEVLSSRPEPVVTKSPEVKPEPVVKAAEIKPEPVVEVKKEATPEPVAKVMSQIVSVMDGVGERQKTGWAFGLGVILGAIITTLFL